LRKQKDIEAKKVKILYHLQNVWRRVAATYQK
jgi:hypothetical protein